MTRFDAIVIGAGVNGLAAGALLAKSGRKVCILERRDTVGGVCAPREFHPGFTAPGLLHDTTRLDSEVAAALDLSRHGLRRSARNDVLFTDGGDGRLLVSADAAATADALRARGSEASAASYQRWRQWLTEIGPLVRRLVDEPPMPLDAPLHKLAWPTLKIGRSLRKLGRRGMMEFLRIPSMCLADWLQELFDDELLAAGLALPALEGAWAGPWSAGTAVNLLIREAVRGDAVVGGSAAIADALNTAATTAGASIMTGASVAEIRTTDGRVDGVTLADGDSLDAANVVSALDPRTTFLDLLSPTALDPRVADDFVNWRCRGALAKVHLGIVGAAPFTHEGAPISAVRVVSTLDDGDRAFDAIKYRTIAEHPALDVRVPSMVDTDLAPDGHHVVSVLFSFAPDADADVDIDALRGSVLDRTLAALSRIAPGIADRVVGREVLMPADIAAEYGLAGGHLFHGETGLDQLMIRPSLACGGHGSPISGLFLCGPGTHPGTAPTGASARLAVAAAKI